MNTSTIRQPANHLWGMTLDGLEQLLKVAFRRRRDGARQYRLKVNLIRYADDFIITGPTKYVLENEVRPLVEEFLRDRGLQLSPEKTCTTPEAFADGAAGHGSSRVRESLRKQRPGVNCR